MKINIFTCSVSRESGGLKDAIKDLYKCFEEINSKITIFSFIDNFTKDDAASWSPLVLKLYKKNNPFYYSSRVADDLLSSNSNILHIHGLWRYPHAFAIKWKKKTKKPIIASPHGMLDSYIIQNQGIVKRTIGNILFANKAFNSIDCFHALCNAEYEDIRSYGITAPVAIIPNGVVMPFRKTFLREDNDKIHILFLARLHPKKGVDMLVEAFGQLRNESPVITSNVVIDIVGWSQDGYEKIINQLINSYSLENNVVLHGGKFEEEKDEMYAKADVYILPSHGEGLPMTVLEAWSWGKPVIMTKFCNLPEGFDNNAAIKIDNNVKSIKEGLKSFLSMSVNERLAMGENGMKLVESNFTWQLSAKKMKALYDWVLGNQQKPDFILIN